MATAKKPAQPKKPRGRPSLYTVDLGQEICARLSNGEPMAQICRDEGMPCVQTVNDWMDSKPEFSVSIARARVEGFDALAAECLVIANNPLEGVETTTKDDGRIEEKRGDMLGHRKLQIDTRLKLLAKWDPKRYGEKLSIGGADDLPSMQVQSTINVKGLSTSALAEIMAASDAAKRD
jgi:hypothetical protein